MGADVGVPDVPECLRAAALPDRQNRPQGGLSTTELEPPPVHLLPTDPSAALLRSPRPKSGSGCPDPPPRREPGSRKEIHPEHARHENYPSASNTAWRRAGVKSAFHKMLAPIGRGLRLFKG